MSPPIGDSDIRPYINDSNIRLTTEHQHSHPPLDYKNIRPSVQSDDTRPSIAPKPHVSSPVTSQTSIKTELHRKLDAAWKKLRSRSSKGKIYENQEEIDMQLRRELPSLARMPPLESTRLKNQYTNVEGGALNQTLLSVSRRPADVSTDRFNKDTKLRERAVGMEVIDGQVASHSAYLNII